MKQILKRMSNCYNETIEIGKEIINKIPKETKLVILIGDVGSGKTTLIKGMALELNEKEIVTSPTYGYKKSYDKFVHYDFYLIKKMKTNGILSLISEESNNKLIFIEWGKNIPKIKDTIIINIKTISNEKRIIRVY